MKRRRRVTSSDLKSKAAFSDHFEERKALEYLRNLINSPLLPSKVKGLLDFSYDALGQVVSSKFIKKHPELLQSAEEEAKELQFWQKNWDPFDDARQRLIARFLKNDVTPMLERRIGELAGRRETELQKRLHILQKTFKLSNREREIITILYLSAQSVLTPYLRHDNVIDLDALSTFSKWLHAPLGLSRGAVAQILRDGRLVDLGMSGKTRLADWCDIYLACIGSEELTSDFYSSENDVTLDMNALDVADDERMVLDTLMRGKGGFNILFHGEPGTGKTTLAKCLAKEYGQQLFTVKIPKDNNNEQRISGIHAALNTAGKRGAVILIDEADELLNTRSVLSIFLGADSNKGGKSWINNLLENHNRRVIWITNRVNGIDPSTMRRFAFSMEFRSLNEKRRYKIIKAELERKGLSDYFSDENLREICCEYHTTAAGIIDAIKILGVDRNADRGTALRKVKTVLKNHELVVFGDNAGKRSSRELKSYTIEGLHCSENPADVVSTLKRYVEYQEKGKPGQNGAASLLLYGMPGTGKSEFVYHLGQTLGKEVLLTRCSDIQSMWVGATEKNIATAFRQAQEDGSLLFFDEADSFLFPRKDASHSWEKNFTNEILTQLESFNGIVALATNDMEGLDHASLRRFRFKIEFRPLTAAGILHFYTTLLGPLVQGDGPSGEELMVLSQIGNLTPGDFAVVRDRYGFAGGRAESHRQLIEALMNEVRYKKGAAREIGF